MKAHSKFMAITALIAMSVTDGFAGNYYVATTGNDTNPGTNTTAPWRTIQKAANTLTPGDTVLVRGGVYNELVTVNVSGSAAGGRVVCQNLPGESPIIDRTGL